MTDLLRKYGGGLIVVLAIILGTSYFIQVHHEQTRASCQSKFNTAFAQSLKLRSDLSGQRQDAEDGLLTTVSSLVLHPAKTVEEKQKASADYVAAFKTYEAANAAYAATKAANPLPELPSC